MLFEKQHISVKVSESELKGRNRALSLLLEMSNFLATSKRRQDLLTGALSKIMEYFDLEAGRIYLVTDGSRHLHLAAHQGMDATGLEKVNRAGSFSGRAFRTRTFIAHHVSELEDKKRAFLLSSRGFNTIICVPLITMDKVEGVMNLATSKMIELDQEKIDLLTTLGNQIAVAANITKLYEDLRSKIKTLKEKKDVIKFFAYSVSHDLKSPAVGIYGLTKRLQEKYGEALDEKGREYCKQILKTTEQMIALVDSINAYIVTKEAPLNLEKVKVNDVTKTIKSEFSTILNQHQVRWSEPRTLPEIVADRLALSRVFRNFVDNALKYGGRKMSKITVGYREEGSSHILSFSDDGVGIKKGDEDKIFEPFQRNETSKGTSGSGLGLAIVNEIAKRHHGRVWIDSGTKNGTTFCISISMALKGNE